MKKTKTYNSLFYFYARPFALCALLILCSGCVRLTGGAGVWKQGANDEAPTTHEVGFDTNQLAPQSNNPRITNS